MNSRDEEKGMTEEIALTEFDALCKKILLKKKELDAAKAVEDKISKELEAMKGEVLAHFKNADIERHSVKGLGTVSVTSKSSVKVPVGADRQAFFEYLRKQGIFETMITVNSATLNSWYNQEMEAAIATGKIDFQVPGILEPKPYDVINIRGV